MKTEHEALLSIWVAYVNMNSIEGGEHLQTTADEFVGIFNSIGFNLWEKLQIDQEELVLWWMNLCT